MANQDKCYNYDELNEDLLKQFSEGSNSLENLLKFCYENKIVTRACCIGHDDNKESENPFPYISFIIDKDQYKLMESVFNKLLIAEGIKENTRIEIAKENEKILLCIRFMYNQENIRENFFNLLELLLKQYLQENKVTNGKYDNLFDAFNILCDEEEISEININYQELIAFEEKAVYFKFEGIALVETTKEEAEFSSEKVEEKYKVKSDDIENYINNLINAKNIMK